MFKYLILSTAATLALSFSTFAEQAKPALKSQLVEQNLLTDIVNVQGKLVAVGERGHIIYSLDGENWQQASVPVNVLLTAVDFVDDKVGFAVGHDATLLTTKDGGVTWHIVNYQPELDKPLLNVKVIGQQVIAIGAYGLYWHSTDAGKTWRNEFHDELLIEDDRLFLEDLKQYEPEAYEDEKQFMLPHFNDVALVGKQLILAGEGGFLALSDDNGNNWQLLESDYFGSYFSVIDTPNGAQIAGLRGNLFTSSDFQTWQSLNTPATATVNDSLFEQNVVYHFANSGKVFFSQAAQPFQLYSFADGKAVMSGTVKDQVMYFATEAGVKSLPVKQLIAGKQ